VNIFKKLKRKFLLSINESIVFMILLFLIGQKKLNIGHNIKIKVFLITIFVNDIRFLNYKD